MSSATRRSVIACLAALGGLMWGPAVLWAQNTPMSDEQETRANVRAVFVTDRGTVQLLARAERLLKESDYVDGLAALQAIFDMPEDSFPRTAESDGGPVRGVKAEAARLLAEMPLAGRRAYELQFGDTARRLFDEAVTTRNTPQLEDVARRFFHTVAGCEATYLLGASHLDHGRPLAAAMCFERLRRYPEASRRWGDLLTLKAAICWTCAGLLPRSRERWGDLHGSAGQTDIKLGGRTMRLPEAGSDGRAWLAALAGRPLESSALRRDGWLMFRGDPARNASTTETSPVADFRWQHATVVEEGSRDSETWEDIRRSIQAFDGNVVREQGAPPNLPAAQPLAVGDMVVFRTVGTLRAVRLATGALVWQKAVPDPNLDRLMGASAIVTPNAPLYLRSSPRRLLKERLWEDVACGSLSSDGESVFMLERPRVLSEPISFHPRIGASSRETPRESNRLLALELQSGKLQWEVGGPRGECELELAATYFLGPPLPVGDRLYCLAEMGGEIRLLALRSGTGELDWSQALVAPETDLLYEARRRLAGIGVAHAGGIVVCPTGVGATVAVDLSQRALRWGYRYQSNIPALLPAERAMLRMWMAQARMMGRGGWSLTDNARGWVDAVPVVGQGRIVLTPSDSDELHCLDLLDGSLIWKRPREQGLYVAGIFSDNVVVVGQTGVRALRLSDGGPAWSRTTPIATPSGRGFRTAERYHIPLTTGEVATINLNDGRILARSMLPSTMEPGNLVAASGTIVSQAAYGISGFESLEALKRKVAERLEADPDDLSGLALRGNMRLHQGETERGLSDLYRVIALNPQSSVRGQIVATLLEGLRFDFAAHRQSADEIAKLVQTPQQRAAFLRVYADGLQTSGDHQEAFVQYLELAGTLTGELPLERIGGTRSVRADRWVRARLASLYADATTADRDRLDQEVQSRFEKIASQDNTDASRQFLDSLAGHPIGARARRELIDRLKKAGDVRERRWHLQRLLTSPDPSAAGFGAARIVPELIEVGRTDVAATIAKDLETRWADAICVDDKTGRKLVEDWRADKGMGDHLIGRVAWPDGPMAAVETALDRSVIPVPQILPVPILGPRGRWFEHWSLELDHRRQQLLARGGDGETRWQLSVQNDFSATHSAVVPRSARGFYARACGQLLVVVLEDQFAVLDAFTGAGRTEVLWRRNLVSRSMQHGLSMPRQRVVGPGLGQRVPGAFRLGGGMTFSTMSYSVGAVGAMTGDLVCYQLGTELHAAEPLTGETLWVRGDVPIGSEIQADDEYVIVMAPGSDQVTVLRASDGSQYLERSIPRGQRLTADGRHLLTWAEQDGRQVLANVDVVSGESGWSREFAQGSHVALVKGEDVAVLEPAGRFAVVGINDGKPRLESQLESETAVNRITVLRSSDQYLLLTSRPVDNASTKLQIHTRGLPQSAVNGRAYAFSRRNGDRLWSKLIDDQAINLNQPDDLPILVFTCRKQEWSIDDQKQRHSLDYSPALILDRRTGDVVYEDEGVRVPVSSYRIRPDRVHGRIDVDFHRSSVALTFPDTEKPAPP